MDRLREIEAAVDALPETQQKELFQHLAERLEEHQEHAEQRDDAAHEHLADGDRNLATEVEFLGREWPDEPLYVCAVRRSSALLRR